MNYEGKKLYAAVKDIAVDLLPYIRYKVKDGKVTVQIKEKAVSSRLKRMGIYILVYRGDCSWEECLVIYKSKEIIERGFDIIKNDLALTTPYIHKDGTLKGILFICFLALIMRMRLIKVLQEKGEIKNYSFEKIILELDNGELMNTEITKKQKQILNVFNAVPKT